ncbi:serine/threonine-protein kinase [Planomonospora algeriensis]
MPDDRTSPPALPERIGGYPVRRLLGRGGMGVVYLAEGPGGVPVAVKVIRGEHVGEPDYRRRFRREVKALKRVAASAAFCTPAVLDARVDGDHAFFVTEYVEGPTLEQKVRRDGPLRGRELEELARETARGLRAVHGSHVLHRDLKPANVLLSPDGPKIIDFGIAQLTDTLGPSTRTVMGTVGYMSPEQLQRHPLTAASDLFSWGAVVAFAATGRCPFGEEDPGTVMYRLVFEEADLTGMDDRMAAVVARVLEKDPESRPDVDAVLGMLDGAPVPAPPPAPTAVLWPPSLPDAGGEAEADRSPPRRRGRVRPAAAVSALVLVTAAPIAALLALDGRAPWSARTGASPTCVETEETASRPLPLEKFDTTRMGTVTGGAGHWTVVSRGQYTWTGLRAALPDWCSYQIDFDAKINSPTHPPASGMGWGYGIGVCSRFDGHRLRGPSLQYSFFQEERGETTSFGIVHLPDANSFPSPQPTPPPGGVDYGTHHWRIVFDHGKVRYVMDHGAAATGEYAATGPSPLLADCAGTEFVVRAWLADVEISNPVLSPG